MKAVNGTMSWIETHYEIVAAITTELIRDKPQSNTVWERHEAQGTGGMYELAEELTDKFEALNEDREWDGEFFDEIEEFINQELYND